jgi:hypothetical protein
VDLVVAHPAKNSGILQGLSENFLSFSLEYPLLGDTYRVTRKMHHLIKNFGEKNFCIKKFF